jgi:UDP-N-acetylglucosamine--N-acetylmuramyl-(pentapeptide) pyrophosphoryl-undecaprenol N-acetylglucosamine transferase
MGGGGYVAGPVGVAALSLGIPLVLTEADSHLGLTNRMLAPFARRVCLAFAMSGRDSGRYRVTGRPIPPAEPDRVGARERFGLTPRDTCVLVFGGSLGARSINLAAVEAFAPTQASTPGAAVAPASVSRGIQASVRVLHISGRRDHPELLARQLPAGYDLRDYLDLEDFAQALAAADLVVARSGGSVFELAAHGLPAILVPYPHASGDHQTANARWMADAGAAVLIADQELSSERLREEVAVLLGDRARLAAMAVSAASLARPDAARDVASELLKAAG